MYPNGTRGEANGVGGAAAQPPALAASYPVLGGGYLLAGRAAADIKRKLGELDLPAELVRRVVVAAYEAEMNICLHAISGALLMRVEGKRVALVAWDRGPGIADLAKALTPGFSTASPKARQLGFGAGMGFTNMQRCADCFHIESTACKGTRVQMSFAPRDRGATEGAA
jgi:anti-sigma regulatory factor (Ser/Thr protein kinase)